MPSALIELKHAAIMNALRGCRLLADLPAADLEKIAAITTPRSMARGEYLFHEGDPARGFFIVQRGAVNVHRVNAAGKEQVLHVFRSGETFAEAALTAERGYPAAARAEAAAQVLQVHKDGMLTLIRRQPELALRMLAAMSAHLQVLVGQLEDLTLKDVETRFTHWLLRRCPDPRGTQPVPIRLATTKRALAAELGTVGETLSRTLGKFRARALIQAAGQTITVLSPARLAVLSDKA